jgi:phosphoribosylformylglycinamidine cyclo-ligase
MDYKQAGVNIEEGYRAVEKYRDLAAGTHSPAVINDIGSFAGMFSLAEIIRAGAGMEEPVLISGTDGVGTKLDVAFRLKKYDTLGIDCVAMCVNDILCHGARPLFFLDYLACGKLDADVAAELVKGVARGCRETGSALLGGETAEMPGFYDDGKYDIAGFAVGIADRKNIVDGRKIREGDVLVGIASSGPHSSGFSLIRRVLPNLDEDFGGMPLGLALLEPTRLYVKPVLGLMAEVEVRGMAHITGGGFYENIPRMFNIRRMFPAVKGTAPAGGPSPATPALAEAAKAEAALAEAALAEAALAEAALAAVIKTGSWTIPPIFERIAGGIAAYENPALGIAATEAPGKGLSGAQAEGAKLLQTDEKLKKLLFNTYNMGIGFVLALAPEDGRRAVEYLDSQGFPAWEIGRVEKARDTGLRFE